MAKGSIWGGGGRAVWWTEQRVHDGLAYYARLHKGEVLPRDSGVLDRERVERADPEIPPARVVRKYYGNLIEGWLAVEPTIVRKRIPLRNRTWSEAHDTLLLQQAGVRTLTALAVVLHRSYGSLHRRLMHHGTKARTNQGTLSAAEVAREFNCPYHRVRLLLIDGSIPGRRHRHDNRWVVNLDELTDEHRALLAAPKQTWTASPPDLGDYEKRYGLGRVNGVRRQKEGRDERRQGRGTQPSDAGRARPPAHEPRRRRTVL